MPGVNRNVSIVQTSQPCAISEMGSQDCRKPESLPHLNDCQHLSVQGTHFNGLQESWDSATALATSSSLQLSQTPDALSQPHKRSMLTSGRYNMGAITHIDCLTVDDCVENLWFDAAT